MDSRRQLKVASLIQEAFTDILARSGKSIYGKAFVTVTRTTVTSDLTLSRFYLSIFNTEDTDEVIKHFNEHKYELKKQLGTALRHHLRRIPEIEFFKDETLNYAYHIEEVFKKINEEDTDIRQRLKAKPKKVKTAGSGKKKTK
jgi:ribosome-binding factor A